MWTLGNSSKIVLKGKIQMGNKEEANESRVGAVGREGPGSGADLGRPVKKH